MKQGINPIMKMLGKKEEITMDRDEYIREHKRLPKILTSGTKKQRLEEAKRQEEELEEMLGDD